MIAMLKLQLLRLSRQLQCNMASLKETQGVEIFDPRNKKIYTLHLTAEDTHIFILLKTLKFHI